jgi:hypothetical protein
MIKNAEEMKEKDKLKRVKIKEIFNFLGFSRC